jgi:hypothetical protein
MKRLPDAVIAPVVIARARRYFKFLLRCHYEDVVQTAALVQAERHAPEDVSQAANRELFRLAHDLGYYRPNLPGRPWRCAYDLEEVASLQKPMSTRALGATKGRRLAGRWESAGCAMCGKTFMFRIKRPRKFCSHACYRSADPAMRKLVRGAA